MNPCDVLWAAYGTEPIGYTLVMETDGNEIRWKTPLAWSNPEHLEFIVMDREGRPVEPPPSPRVQPTQSGGPS
jgi:hypothetical protein